MPPFEVLLAIWIGAASVASYVQFFWDKLSAQKGWRRVSESALLGTALLGGALGGKIAQRVFRHKTRKEPFRTHLNRALVFNIVGVAVLLVPQSRECIIERAIAFF